MSDVICWGLHAGRSSEADHLFRQQNRIGIGWPQMRDLTELADTRTAFKARFGEVFPDEKDGAIPVKAGMLFRFVHEMEAEHIILYPSKITKKVHIGRIKSDYRYTPKRLAGYPHQRDVEWLKEVSRTRFSQGALYELGSAMSLFQVQNYAEEYLAALEGREYIAETKNDDSISLVADEVEQITRDFVQKRVEAELKGHPLESFVANLLEVMGYHARTTRDSRDGGVDVIAHRDELGIEPPIIKVQVKSTSGTIGIAEVSSLYGTVDTSEVGLFVTLGGFSRDATQFAATRSNLRLIDGEEFLDLVLRYYDALSSKYQAVIPLKRVFIPEAVEEIDE